MRFSRRLVLALALLALMVLLAYNWNDDWKNCSWAPAKVSDDREEQRLALRRCYDEASVTIPLPGSCALVRPSTSTINTAEVYPQLNFQVTI